MGRISCPLFFIFINIFVALNKKDFKEVIESKSLIFNDDYFSLRGDYITTSDGISFYAYNALKDVNDVKSNNFSNLFLSHKQKNSEILQSRYLKDNNTLNIVTTLSFFAKDSSNKNNPGVWLVADKSYDVYEMDMTSSSFKLVEGIPQNYNNYLFNLKAKNEHVCQISHTFGELEYYLAYKDGFTFCDDDDDPQTEFIYHLDNNFLKLYFLINEELYVIKCEEKNGIWFLTLSPDDNDDNASIIYINDEKEIINYFIDSCWIKYDSGSAINTIDSDKSTHNLESQFLIHHEYSDDSNLINFVPLKNSLTYQGTVTNGTNLTISNNGKFIERPLVDFRNYTTINSGYNQEHGTENITLCFTFNDQVLHLNEGDECIFSIAEFDSTKDIFPPLYPYKSININDTAFVRNGAFASDVPYFADKFKKLQNENTFANNYTYLCTWLFQPDEESTPIWLDRYYYPDLQNRQDSLRSANNKIFDISFENIIDKFYLNDDIVNSENSIKEYGITPYVKAEIENFKSELKQRAYVDKKSDMTIEPGTTYKYSRISKEMVNEVYDNISSNRIEQVKDQYTNDIKLSDLFALNGENWRKIPTEKFNNTQSINFNTNLYVKPTSKIGIQIFGCDYKYGFNIQNRKDLCPFTYYADANSIYMLNNSFKICNQFNFKEKYNIEIEYAVINGPFEDLYILSTDSLFILDYDLRLKNRIELATILNNGNINDNIKTKISKKYITVYNKNLYAAVDNDILKIIFNPESKNEQDLIGNNSVTARILNKTEYITNYNMVADESLVQTIAAIKSIYIHNGDIYAFNYDILKMSHDSDTIYGIIKQRNESDNPDSYKWYYIFNQSVGRMYATVAASKYAEFSSDISIDNIATGPDGYFALIRGFESNKNKSLEIYDKSKTKIYNYPLTAYTKIISLDYYRYIDNAFEEHDVFVALLSLNGYIVAVEYQIESEKIKTYYTTLQSNVLPSFTSIINSNEFITRLNENKLYFNLNLPDNLNTLTYIWDLNESQEGWYNINVEIDMNEAIYRIKINDLQVADLKHNNFIPHQHTNSSIFDATYYLGTIGKKYGTSLNEILMGNILYDPYACMNSKIENTTLYNRTLAYYEYQANRLYFTTINPLTLTIPCGVRNGIEEIVRYFKYNKPGAVSNKLKINISGIEDIKLESEIEALKTTILDAIADADCLTTIKEIEFI